MGAYVPQLIEVPALLGAGAVTTVAGDAILAMFNRSSPLNRCPACQLSG
jgi:class 3 adenylate cyclase